MFHLTVNDPRRNVPHLAAGHKFTLVNLRLVQDAAVSELQAVSADLRRKTSHSVSVVLHLHPSQIDYGPLILWCLA